MKQSYLFLFLLSLVLVFSACGSSDSMTEPPTESTYPAEALEIADEAAASEGFYGGGESYLVINENQSRLTEEEATVTFSLKVDTAAYTNVARYIESGRIPPKDAIRTEELINYFPYDGQMYFPPHSPFALYTELGPSPFNSGKHLAFIRVKAVEIEKENLPGCNFTFLIDTSGSMNSHDKLPLLKQAFLLLVDTLDADDTVSIVTYAGSSEILLDSVSGADKQTIQLAIEGLDAGGSTAGGEGIQTAYTLAEKNFLTNGNNRVILASDGDFNVGISDVDELKDLIAEKRDSGIYLSVLGFGTGNIRDDMMETLAVNGNGNYSYINNLATGKKVLVEEMGSTLYTIADDVKAQVEFNPDHIQSYRLIGYENRQLQDRDFEDDTKDAGEIGVGTDVVILFELELNGNITGYNDELFEVRIRYKDPGGIESKLLTEAVGLERIAQSNSSDYRFAASVAAFGHLLRNSEYTGTLTLADVIALAESGLGNDSGGYRWEYVELLERYGSLIG